jgi:hypothetical protein
MNKSETFSNLENSDRQKVSNPHKKMSREEIIDFAAEQVARLFWQQILFEQSRKWKGSRRKKFSSNGSDTNSNILSTGGGNGS